MTLQIILICLLFLALLAAVVSVAYLAHSGAAAFPLSAAFMIAASAVGRMPLKLATEELGVSTFGAAVSAPTAPRIQRLRQALDVALGRRDAT